MADVFLDRGFGLVVCRSGVRAWLVMLEVLDVREFGVVFSGRWVFVIWMSFLEFLRFGSVWSFGERLVNFIGSLWSRW